MSAVVVVLVPVAPGAATDPVLLDRLDESERRSIASLGFAADRDRAVTARAAARFELGARLGLDPRKVPLLAPDGRSPEVGGFRIGISWAHSGRWVALAIGWDRRVGVDVEKVPAVLPAKALARIGLGSLEEFVAREAAGKVTGQGPCGQCPANVRVAPFDAPAGYVGAVAGSGDDWRIEVRVAERIEPPVIASVNGIGAWDNFGSAYHRLGRRTSRSAMACRVSPTK